jgi:hypothetical protein
MFVRQDSSMGVVGVTKAWSAMHAKPDAADSSKSSGSSSGSSNGKNTKENLTIQRSTATLKEKLRYYAAGTYGTVLNVSIGCKLPPPNKFVRRLGPLVLIVIVANLLLCTYRLNLWPVVESIVCGLFIGLSSMGICSTLAKFWKSESAQAIRKSLSVLIGTFLCILLLSSILHRQPSQLQSDRIPHVQALLYSLNSFVALLLKAPCEFLVCFFVAQCMKLYVTTDVDIDFEDEPKKK